MEHLGQSSSQGLAEEASGMIHVGLYMQKPSRKFPLPIPREILEVEYPQDDRIIDALCQVKLTCDAPDCGLAKNKARNLTHAWDHARCAIEAVPLAPLENLSVSQAPDVLIMTPVESLDTDSSTTAPDGSMTFTLTASSASLLISPPEDEVPSAASSMFLPRPDKETEGEGLLRPSKSASLQVPQGVSGGKRRSLNRPSTRSSGSKPSLASGNVLRDDHGYALPLDEPTKEDYAAAIMQFERDKKTGTKLNGSPHTFPSRTPEYPYNLGPPVSWAPYFMHGKPHAGVFRPTKTHVGSAGQLPMPYVRCVSETESPLALPALGQDHAFTPDFATTTPPDDFLCPPKGPPSTAPPMPVGDRAGSCTAGSARLDSLSISEYARAAGKYSQWTHVGIALHMIAGHIDRSHVETAGTGYVDLTKHLIKNAKCLGLLPQSAYPSGNPSKPPLVGVPVSMREKKAFWGQFYALSHYLFKEQVLRVKALFSDDPRDRIPDPAAAAETPLTGQPYRHGNMMPEAWWIFGRRPDDDWHTFFAHYYWQELLPNYDNLPVHPIPWCAGEDSDSDEEDEREEDEEDSEEEEDDDGDDNGDDGNIYILPEPAMPLEIWPNIVSQTTMAHMRGCLRRLYFVLYGGNDGSSARPDADELLPKDQYKELLSLANDCVSGFQRLQWGRGDGPRSHITIRQDACAFAKSYKHPLELYSSID